MSIRTSLWLAAAAGLMFWAGASAQTPTNLLPNGSFESGKPSFWHADSGTVAGTKLTWAKDQKHGGTHSLKIEKPTAGDTARWYSDNNVRYWVDNIPKGVDIKLGAWVKTSGVNTSPANAAAKWQIKVAFYDTLGAMIGSAPFALDVDQSAASRDWYADTNGVGTVNLPKTAFKMVMSAEGGPNATGTVWFDDFMFVGRGGAWAGQNWDGNVDADSGWQYWIGPNGGNDGLTDFPGTGVTDSVARTGKYSLRISANPGRATSEAVFFSETVPIPANSKDKQYVLSAWVKTSNIQKDSAKNPSSSLGFTVTWQSKLFSDAGGWNEVGSNEEHIVLINESQDWTQYSMLLTVPGNDVTAISVRPRAYNLFTGVSFWDDFSLNGVLSGPTSVRPGPDPVAGGVPAAYVLEQNYPNPFNPSTHFRFSLPQMQRVSVKVFDVIGRVVAVLANEQLPAGTYTIEWNAANVPSGVYFYRLEAGNYSAVKKMLLLK